MNVDDLRAELQSRSIPNDAFSVGVVRDEAYCLVKGAGVFEVFYSERGNRNRARAYTSENAACHDLLDRLLRDAAVMARAGGRERGEWPGAHRAVRTGSMTAITLGLVAALGWLVA